MSGDAYLERLQDAIRKLHGCESKHIQTVPVVETFKGKTVWDGEVEVFDLIGHPKASKCYAWAYNKDEGEGSRIVAVLEPPPVISPKTAVRAAIAAALRR